MVSLKLNRLVEERFDPGSLATKDRSDRRASGGEVFVRATMRNSEFVYIWLLGSSRLRDISHRITHDVNLDGFTKGDF